MAKYRFYQEPSYWEAEELTADEAHHCRDVMRCSSGDQIILFDGCGKQREVKLTNVSKRVVAFEVLSETSTEPLAAEITLGQAIPKGKNMDLIIQKATELGVSRIVPLQSTNTVVKLKANELAKKQAKWQRIAIEACKQCGQNWLPEVTEPMSVEDYVASREQDHALNIVAAIDPKSLPFKEIVRKFQTVPGTVQTVPGTIASILIGPEGDLTQQEVQTALDAEFQPMSLGPIILRSETAAIYALSLLVYELMGR